MYKEYFSYVLEHKKNVYLECMDRRKYLLDKINSKYCSETEKKGCKKIRRMLLIHAFTHDLSKFNPLEFIPYAKKFYGDMEVDSNKINKQFSKAWKHHYKNNKHHPEYWNGKSIPNKYLEQMLCDLKAMSRKFGGSAQEYYLKNYYKWNLERGTRFRLELKLDLIDKLNGAFCECNQEYWSTVEELINEMNYNESNLKDLLKHAYDTYNIDIYNLYKSNKIE